MASVKSDNLVSITFATSSSASAASCCLNNNDSSENRTRRGKDKVDEEDVIDPSTRVV